MVRLPLSGPVRGPGEGGSPRSVDRSGAAGRGAEHLTEVEEQVLAGAASAEDQVRAPEEGAVLGVAAEAGAERKVRAEAEEAAVARAGPERAVVRVELGGLTGVLRGDQRAAG